MPGSPMSGFTEDDPIRLLAHNLDFWIPAVTEVVHETLEMFPTRDDRLSADSRSGNPSPGRRGEINEASENSERG